jgi:hypothetical protein
MTIGDLRYGRIRQHTPYCHGAVGGNCQPRFALGIDHERLVLGRDGIQIDW